MSKKKTITRTRQYLRGSAICLRSWSCRDFTIVRKKYKVRLQFFFSSLSLSLSKNTATTQTLITQLRFIHKTGQNFFRPKPSLHGLNLRKSPIKNHATLFGSGQVVEPNQSKLGFTLGLKNIYFTFQKITLFILPTH